jgi:hypothetical protein
MRTRFTVTEGRVDSFSAQHRASLRKISSGVGGQGLPHTRPMGLDVGVSVRAHDGSRTLSHGRVVNIHVIIAVLFFPAKSSRQSTH